MKGMQCYCIIYCIFWFIGAFRQFLPPNLTGDEKSCQLLSDLIRETELIKIFVHQAGFLPRFG